MVRIDSSGNFLEDMNTMTTIDNEGNLRYIPMSGKNTQKKKKKDGFLDNWVQAPQVFEDGFQISDIPKTILGTGADIGLGIVQGIVAGGEGIGDLLTYGASGISRLAGNDELADQLKENAKINATEEIFGVVKNRTGLEKASVIGSKGDQVSNAIGTILTLTSTAGLGGAAGLGKTGQTIVSMGSMGASSVGAGMSEAYQGGATDEEAVKYGLISGAAEVGSEMLFGGLGKGAKAVGISQGLTGADDMLAKTISDKFKSQLAKNLAEYTVKAGAEGVEEVISGLAQAWGKKMTYMSEEDLSKLIADEKLLDQFIVGMVSSGLSQAPGLVKTTSKGQDYLTGYTQNEQKVYDALLQERIEEEQSESKKPLTKKQINAIEEEFRQDFENGNISTKKIEEVLGYEDIYNNLKDTTENALAKTLTAQDEAGIREEAKQEYAKRIKDDEFIKKNYYEDTQRTKAYNVDVNQYDKKYRGTIQKAIDSGILNNSTKTHQFVDFISKLAADKGVTFDFTNNEALKNSSLGIDGATVNGYVNANGDITLNINSAKSLNSVVGHEITHVLEGSDLYQALSDSLKEYAETKGEYAKRYNELQELYKNVDGADITKELNADLVGDYLFTNQEFINHLTQNRNLFQRIYDEIKYLVKQATAGSKEQRQLNKAMKMFEKAYKDNSVKLAEQEASTQPKYSITQDSNGKELSKKQQEYFKDSKAVDENGNLITVYHGTNNAGFNIFNKNFNYYTDNKDIAQSYTGGNENASFERLNNIDDAKNWLDGVNEDLYIEGNNVYDYDGDTILEYSTNDELLRNLQYDLQKMYGDTKSGGYYEGYVNITNPLIIDVKGDKWSGIDINNIGINNPKDFLDKYGSSTFKERGAIRTSTNDIVSAVLDAIDEGELNYDGVIFKNIIDEGMYANNSNNSVLANDYVTFNSNQFKNANNTNPTSDPDIRYSLTQNLQDNDINTTNDINNDFFKDHESDFDKNNGKRHILYDNYGNKIEQTTNVYKLEKDNNLAKLSTTLEQNVDDNYGKLYIEELYVKNKGEGLGTEIINSLKQYAKENNLDLYTMKELGNPKTQKFWNSVTEQEFGLDKTSRQLYSYYQPGYNISKTDSNGNKLSYQQRQYFKDSKVVDENRNLIPMYHGTPNGEFTVFRPGSYFSPNKQYADGYQNTWASSISSGKVETNPKTYEVYLNITNPFSIQNEDAKNIYLNEYIKGGNSLYYDPYTDYTSTINNMDEIDWTEGEDLATWLQENHPEYDGLVLDEGGDGGYGEAEYRWRGKSYMPFSSNQVKNVDNTNPTDNPDIRYSLTKKVDTELDELTDEQYEYFKNTKAVDNEGELEVVYHGTPHEFSVFDIEKAGETGLAFGNGFYFTNSKGSAMGYTDGGLYGDSYDQVKEGYINIEKPASRDTKTMTYNEFYNLYNALNENPNMYDEEMGMSNIDALLSDYGDIYNDKENTIKKFYDSYDDDVSLIDNLSYIGNPTEMYKTLRDVTGYDGIIPENPNMYDSFEKIYIAFNPDQFKLKSNKTPTDNVDMNLSLSRTGEDIAPIGNYNVYGKDIELQQTAPIRQDLVDLQNDIAAIKEDYRKQSEDIKKELQALRQEREEIDRGVNEVAPIDEYTPVESDIAPYESETAYPNTNVAPLDDKLLNKYKKYFKENFYFKGKQLDNAMEGIKELSANPELTQEDVYKYFKKNFGKYETQQMNYSINEAKSDLRHMEIGVSDEVKKDIAHRYESYNDFRKKNFGKLILVEYNGQNGVDTRFEELSKQYPDLFDASETINPADQLVALSEIANNKGYDTYFAELDDNEVRAYANEMYSMIKDFRNETNQKLAEEQIPLSYLEEIAPTQEEETIDDYYNNLNERITNLETELENIPKREYYDIQSREMDERLSERIEPEKRDILDLINFENAKKNGKKVELVKPVVAKEKSGLRSGIDTLKTMFTNSNAEIDNLSKESGNKMIKIAGDMLNNYSAEASYDITNAQTDNYGNAIGKSVQQLFAPAKEGGLEAPFNDYLINYSNIDRWARGKGSATPLDVSQRLVANYEAKYPQFKRWAADVWKFSENARKNMLDSGMITQNMYNVLSEAYPHYVPYISDSNNFDSTIDRLNELKAKPIKKAIGGATELFPVEEALTRYSFTQKKNLRTNELYKQIYNTLQTNPGQRGAEVGEGYFESGENLYRDDSGNYLTAVIDGEERKVQISDDLFKSLRKDMDTQVKGLEKKLSLITKPLQAFSDVRRKMLTSWRPSFALRNPIKDIQDAFFNSKHTKQMAKNYIPGIVELVKNSTPEVKQFKALYGEGNLMGTFENESGLYETKKGLKNNKFLKGLSSVNEIMELAPRYAEFKASLQAGESVEEAMYNAREVTTNFSRGGVITKALNRNGFTFLNASVQGFDKFIRNFSGENGAKGIANSLLKAVALAVAPAVFNELAFGIGDDKDEEYEALPDYVKDNYYLIKTGDGNFIRIPKGRALSVFGSAARRTIELAEGEEDAFKGYLSNANNQIGINDPEENNIFAPFIQAFGSKNGNAWYGGDIVPSRLQNKPVEEQYDASTDKMSIWLGEHLGVSPYKINYLIDQYSGGIGDLLLPYITDEAKNKGGFIAPIVSEFTTDSTTNNKYVSDFYTKNDELKVKANSSKATDSDLVKNQYMYSVSKQMSELYAERRKVQENNSLTKEQKYEKAQAIKKEINKLAKQGLDTYESGTITGNYAEVGNQEFYKNAKGKWTDVSETDKENINSLGLNNRERDSYFKTSNELYNIDQRYKNLTEGVSEEEKTKYNAQRKVDVINVVKSANLPDEGKAALYDKKYADTDTLNAVLDCNIDFDSYLDLQAQNFTADKDKDGKSISGSKKAKVYGYINSMSMPYEQKIMLAKLEYKSDNTYNNEIINYLNNDPTISYQDMTSILKAMGFKVDEYGNITW